MFLNWYNNKNLLKLLVLVLIIGCKTSTKSKIIKVNYDDANIVYEGRVGKNEVKKVSEIYWSGSSIQINFEGEQLKAILEDQKGTNYFNIFIDNKKVDTLKLKKGKHEYLLAQGLTKGKHTVKFIKRNEWTYGTTLFYGFEIKGYRILQPDPPKSLSIEFYGDSITTGHGNEDYTGENKSGGDVTNNYNTYAAMTARELHAEYTCIARGGIGVMVSWFNMTMPEMYDRVNPNDANSKWNFNEKQPDIVVINLFQNDSWIVNKPDHLEFKRRLGNQKPDKTTIVNSYASFVKTIRGHYPKANIICLLGNMDVTKENSEWPSYVSTAVESLNDSKVHTCFVPYKGTKGHPKVEEHKIIASKLLELIREKIITNP